MQPCKVFCISASLVLPHPKQYNRVCKAVATHGLEVTAPTSHCLEGAFGDSPTSRSVRPRTPNLSDQKPEYSHLLETPQDGSDRMS